MISRDFRVFFPAGKIGLDAKTQMPYSRPLMNASAAADTWRTEAFLWKQTNDPRGWACTWESCDDNAPAGREAFGRLQGRKRHASDTHSTLAARAPLADRPARRTAPPREASNRSRKSIVSSAPLGHNLSGGFFMRAAACPCRHLLDDGRGRGRERDVPVNALQVSPPRCLLGLAKCSCRTLAHSLAVSQATLTGRKYL